MRTKRTTQLMALKNNWERNCFTLLRAGKLDNILVVDCFRTWDNRQCSTVIPERRKTNVGLSNHPGPCVEWHSGSWFKRGCPREHCLFSHWDRDHSSGAAAAGNCKEQIRYSHRFLILGVKTRTHNVKIYKMGES